MAALGAIAELALGAPSKPAEIDVGTPLVIRELDGEKRTLTLSGRALPYRPLELDTSQRLKINWLPGFAEATSTVLGPQEEPTTMRGYWKERFIGRDPSAAAPGPLAQAAGFLQSVSGALSGGFGSVGAGESAPISVDGSSVDTVQDAARLVDDIVRQGQLLEVTWGDQVRRGHIERFRKQWHNTRDLEWEIVFQWTSRGEPITGSSVPTAATALSARDLVQGALDDITAILLEVPAISEELNDLVTSQLQAINTLVEQVSGAVLALSDIASLPASTAQRTAGLMRSIAFEAQSTIALIQGKPPPGYEADAPPATRVGSTVTFLSARASGQQTGAGGIEALSQGQRVDMIALIARLNAAFRTMQRAAAEKWRQLLAQQQSDVIGTYVAREGDDLRDVAFAFYGDFRDWRQILLFNGLSSAQLTAGQVVRVPRQTSGQEDDFR